MGWEEVRRQEEEARALVEPTPVDDPPPPRRVVPSGPQIRSKRMRAKKGARPEAADIAERKRAIMQLTEVALVAIKHQTMQEKDNVSLFM